MTKSFTDLKAILEKKAFAFVATINPDGSPQLTPVWIDIDDEEELVLFNTSRNRSKERNLTLDPRITISALDPDNPYSAIGLRGEVVEITEENANDHIDKMAKKYLGEDKYPWKKPDEVRVIVKIRPHIIW